MKLHFAGSDGTPAYNELLTKQGALCRLESFYALKKKAPSQQFDLLLDSGGFVARTKGVKISVQEYAEYIKAHKVTKAFNLDTNDVQETLDNQFYLEKHTNAYIIPIYHLSDYVENNGLLDKFLDDEYPYIGVGGVAGEGSPIAMQHRFYKSVFNKTRDKVKVHGLGITSESLLEQYPWYSVDSTSWLSFARYGNSKLKDKRVVLFKSKSKHYLENTEEEVKRWVAIEKRITDLWKMRGITWQE